MSVGRGRLVGLVVLVSLIGAGTVAALTLAPIEGFDWSAEALAKLVESWGIWGQLAVIALMIVHSFVPFRICSIFSYQETHASACSQKFGP